MFIFKIWKRLHIKVQRLSFSWKWRGLACVTLVSGDRSKCTFQVSGWAWLCWPHSLPGRWPLHYLLTLPGSCFCGFCVFLFNASFSSATRTTYDGINVTVIINCVHRPRGIPLCHASMLTVKENFNLSSPFCDGKEFSPSVDFPFQV